MYLCNERTFLPVLWSCSPKIIQHMSAVTEDYHVLLEMVCDAWNVTSVPACRWSYRLEKDRSTSQTPGNVTQTTQPNIYYF